MNMKHLSHASIGGLFLVAFASAAFAESEQLREQQQIQQQQREQIQSREHMPSDQGLQQRRTDPHHDRRTGKVTPAANATTTASANAGTRPPKGHDAARRTGNGAPWRKT